MIFKIIGDELKKRGRHKYNKGKEKYENGKKIIKLPYVGPALGIPMCISGILSMILGKLIEGFGLCVKGLGKLIEVIGKGIKVIGQALTNLAQKRLMEIGSNVNAAVINANETQNKRKK